MKNRRFRKTLVMMLIFVLVMSNFMSAITIATSSEFKLSDSAGNPVQGNHYALKTDVYMYSTTMPDGNYYIKVTSPGGTGNLGVTSNPDVEVINGVFPLTQLWSLIHYADTTNNGGQYKVHMNTDSNFPGSSNFTKTFTVGEVLLGTVSGVKFNDLNANNVKDSGEPGLGQWTIMAVLSTNSNTFYTTTTAQDGSYSFNLPVGTWIISEVQQAGWTQSFPTSGSYQITVVGNDTFTDKDFGNWAAITKTGYKFNDLNGNGVWDEGELGLPGFTIYVDYNDNGLLDEGEPSAITTADGSYTISGIVPGTWKVNELEMIGWTQTYPEGGFYEETFVSGMVSEGNDFGNWADITKSGFKFNDLNGNSAWDDGEPGLQNWVIFVDYNDDDNLGIGEPSATTDSNGFYTISGIVPGTWKVKEIQQLGWTQTYPEGGFYIETFISGDELTENIFGNWADITKSGYKFNDLNGNGVWDEGEPGLAGFTIFVDYDGDGVLDDGEPSAITGLDGSYTISGIVPGTWEVREVQQSGWTQTYPEGSFYEETFISGMMSEENNFGNMYDDSLEGGIRIFKDVPNIDDDLTYFDYNIYSDSGLTQLVTSLSGTELVFVSTIVPVGTYYVHEVPESGYSTTTDTFMVIVADEEFSDVYFVNTFNEEPPEPWLVHGYVFYDENGNNTKDAGESGFAGIELYLDGNLTPAPPVTTDSDGYYEWAGIPGTSHDVVVTVESTVPADYEISEYDGSLNESVEVVFGSEYNEPLINFGYKDEGEPPEYYFFNGYVFEDENADNSKYFSEFGYSDIQVTITDGTYTESVDTFEGYYSFYISSLDLAGPTITITVDGPSVTQVSEYDNVPVNVGPFDETVVLNLFVHNENDGVDINFGYYGEEEPYYDIAIDKVADDYSVKVGDTITYTVTVTNTGNETLWWVVVDDTMFGTLDTGSEFAPGQSKTYVKTKLATEVGTLYNEATAEGMEMNVGPVSDDATVTVTDDPPPPPSRYSLSGYVFVDNNSDNSVNGDDVGYEGITVELYRSGGTTPYKTDTTDSNGKYSFSRLRGSYTVVVDPDGDIDDAEVSEYDSTLDQEVDVSMYSRKSNVNFGYKGAPLSTPVIVSGYVFNDIDEDNAVDAGEKGYENIPVQLRDSLTDEVIKTELTNADGLYVISEFLDAGEYVVVNDPLDHMEVMYDAGAQVSEYDDLLDEVIDITVLEGVENVFTERNFGYEEAPKGVTTVLSGYVFNDLNEDNAVDTGEVGYSSVEVTIWSSGLPLLVKTTNANGMYVFDFLTDPELNGLEAGEYTITIGDTPANIHQVSEYDGSPFNKIVVLALADDTEAIANINFGFKDNTVPSGEETNIPLVIFGLFLITSGILIRRRKSYNH